MKVIKFVLKCLVIIIVLSIVFNVSLSVLSFFIGGFASIVLASTITILTLFMLDGKFRTR
jgi:hypothetical protein